MHDDVLSVRISKSYSLYLGAIRKQADLRCGIDLCVIPYQLSLAIPNMPTV